MSTVNALNFIRETLYDLKRDYGCPLDIYRRTEGELDSRTGKKIGVKRTKIEVRKAIVLPTILARKFSYDLTYIAANKNFTYGGFYDINTRLVIIDGVDLPKNFEFVVDTDSIVYDKKRYDLKSAELLEHRKGWLLTIKETVGSTAEEVLEEKVHSVLNLTQSVVGVK